ncbi:MAG: hypothetical protein IT530_11610 [Burkholderiales bacterium]|nr:hypothetical protein [Burkholderiales bacterium]
MLALAPGTRIVANAFDLDYTGRVSADMIEGEVISSEDAKPQRWLAIRRARPAAGRS